MHSPRHLAALLLVLALTAAVTQAFVPSTTMPSLSSLVNSRRIISNGKPPSAPTAPPPTTTVARLSPFDVADALVAAAAETDYEYGAVAAPGWVLPVGAIITLGFAIAVPLFLRPGSEAFEEEKGRLEEMRRGRGQGGQQDEE